MNKLRLVGVLAVILLCFALVSVVAPDAVGINKKQAAYLKVSAPVKCIAEAKLVETKDMEFQLRW